MRNVKTVLALLLGLFFTSSCVGPVTPFGGKTPFSGHVEMGELPPARNITFEPKRQNLHSLHQLKIKIRDDFPALDRLQVFYNKVDVTSLADFSVDKKNIHVSFKHSILIAGRDHEVDVIYKSRLVSWNPPTCELDEFRTLRNTQPFDVSDSLIDAIREASETRGLNPSLVAAIIAQESSFDPKAVSWAKAIGLTQMTNIADREINSVSRNWPRHPATRRYPAPIVKRMIRSGKINAGNEWRVDPILSVEGGAQYLSHIREYWQQDANEDIAIRKLNPHQKLDVILASYNSGQARVKNAIMNKGDKFLEDLNAARHYVDRVRSYCFHFSQEDM